MRLTKILAATTITMAALSTVVTAASASTQAAKPLVNLKAADQGMSYCLAVENDSTAENAKVVLWSCTLETAQNWTYTTAYQYKNAKSGKCLSTAAAATANGTKLTQATCSPNAPEQKWEKSPPTATWYALENVKSGRVLSLANSGAITNGTPAILWSFNNGPEQKWST